MKLFEMEPLTYAYDALEPYLDARTMELHYDKHYRAYTDNLNKLVKGHEAFFNGKTIEEILSQVDEIPAQIKQDVINQGGGYANHSMFWRVLSPNGGGDPSGKLAAHLKEAFGSLPGFKKLLSGAAVAQFGSGYGWLVLNVKGELEIVKTLNQNTPLSIKKTPLLLIDVWEHAYYLKYQNRRSEFVDAIWNVIDWDEVEKTYEDALLLITRGRYF